MDQEDDQLTEIYASTKNYLERLATGELEVVESGSEERIRVYKGRYGSKEFELIVVINGLDGIHTDKHCIEDHLVSAAEQISIAVGESENSKAAWRSLSIEHQLRIYRELKDHRRLLETVCPQQMRGCRYLEDQ